MKFLTCIRDILDNLFAKFNGIWSLWASMGIFEEEKRLTFICDRVKLCCENA